MEENNEEKMKKSDKNSVKEKEKETRKEKEKEEERKGEKEEERRKEGKKAEKEGEKKKEEAFVRGINLPISTKHSVCISRFIRGKKIDEALVWLSDAIKKKVAVPFIGEIPHRKGMMSGRYPVKAAREFIKLLKTLKANAIVNGLDVDNATIEVKANKAARPYKRFGIQRFKRTHVVMRLKEREIRVKEKG